MLARSLPVLIPASFVVYVTGPNETAEDLKSQRDRLAQLRGGQGVNNKECQHAGANCTAIAQAAGHAAGLNDPLCGTTVDTGCTLPECANPGCSTNCTGDAGTTSIKTCKPHQNFNCVNDNLIDCGTWKLGHCLDTLLIITDESCTGGRRYKCQYAPCTADTGAEPQPCGSYWTCAIIY